MKLHHRCALGSRAVTCCVLRTVRALRFALCPMQLAAKSIAGSKLISSSIASPVPSARLLARVSLDNYRAILDYPGELEEASHVCGGSWQQTFRKIILPLLMPGFLAGWIFIAILAFRELSTSILLYTNDSIVLTVLVFDLLEDAQHNWLAALGVLIMRCAFGCRSRKPCHPG